MRNFPAQQYNSSIKSQDNLSSPKKPTSDDKPDWMKRLQEKNKTEDYQTKNIDFDLFPSMNESNSEITYLDDEDDLAASYFPEYEHKAGTSLSNK